MCASRVAHPSFHFSIWYNNWDLLSVCRKWSTIIAFHVMALTLNRSNQHPITCPAAAGAPRENAENFPQPLRCCGNNLVAAFVTARGYKLPRKIIDRSSPSGHFWVKESDNMIKAWKDHDQMMQGKNNKSQNSYLTTFSHHVLHDDEQVCESDKDLITVVTFNWHLIYI